MATRAPPIPAIETTCAYCNADVVLVAARDSAMPVLIDAVEIEYPVVVCPLCRDDPRHRPACSRCLGSGRVGTGTPYFAVAVDERDRARFWHRGVSRRRGEGLYPLHRCRR